MNFSFLHQNPLTKMASFVGIAIFLFSGICEAIDKNVDGFDYPIGSRATGADGDGWYNAQGFEEENDEILTDETVLHAGEDWNGNGGGNTDAGEKVYAIAHGEVVGIRDKTTTSGAPVGQVLILKHKLEDDSFIYSVYLHIVAKCGLKVGDHVARGQVVGSIADIDPLGECESMGNFCPHLHLEIRTEPVDPDDLYTNDRFGGYYARSEDFDSEGFVNPSEHIDADRPVSGTPPLLDLYLIVDISGSFADDLVQLKLSAQEVLDTITQDNPNSRFGVGVFSDYPILPFGSLSSNDTAYEQRTDLTFDKLRVLSVIWGLTTRFGGDYPESQLPALYQAATGYGQDLTSFGHPGANIEECQQADFSESSGSVKVLMLWTDASFHHPGDPGDIPYPGPSFDDTVEEIEAIGAGVLQGGTPSSALEAFSVKSLVAAESTQANQGGMVMGVSSGGDIAGLLALAEATGAVAPVGGIDCDADGVVDIPEGEPIVCNILSSGAGIAQAIVSLANAAIDSAATIIEIDVKPDSDPNCINKRSKGVVPVGILGSSELDVADVDISSIIIGGIVPNRSSYEDVNADGIMDIITHFSTQALSNAGLLIDGSLITVSGSLLEGELIKGSDTVNLAPGPSCF